MSLAADTALQRINHFLAHDLITRKALAAARILTGTDGWPPPEPIEAALAILDPEVEHEAPREVRCDIARALLAYQASLDHEEGVAAERARIVRKLRADSAAATWITALALASAADDLEGPRVAP